MAPFQIAFIVIIFKLNERIIITLGNEVWFVITAFDSLNILKLNDDEKTNQTNFIRLY